MPLHFHETAESLIPHRIMTTLDSARNIEALPLCWGWGASSSSPAGIWAQESALCLGGHWAPGHLLGCWHGHHCLGHFSLELNPKNHSKMCSFLWPSPGWARGWAPSWGSWWTPLKGKGLWAVGLRLLRVPQGKDGAQFPPWKGCLCLKKQQRGLSQLPLMFLLHGGEGSRAASSTGIIPGASWGGWVMAPHVCCG